MRIPMPVMFLPRQSFSARRATLLLRSEGVFPDVVAPPRREAIRFRARASAQLRSGFDRFTPALLFCSAIYLYANLFAFPNIPFLLGGDQVYLWMNAQRMLHGERIYQDFFQFTPPGADLIYLGFFKLFLPHIWVTNAIVLAVGV